MRPIVAFLALLIATATTLLLAGGVACQQNDPKSYELRGKVVNAATGEPVAGALLRLYGGGEMPQFSGSDGGFKFADVPRGQYTISARKPGFFSAQELNSFNAMQDLTTVPGEDTVVKLYPEGIIYGQVKGENDEPLEGISVKAERWRIEGGSKRLEAEGQGVTDDEGNYRIAELRPGSYLLRFEPAGRGFMNFGKISRRKEAEQGYGSQFYPGVPDRGSADAVKIEPGTQAHISQTMSRQRVYEVSGIVLTDEEGDVVRREMTFDRRTGAFQIPGVPAGIYVLTAMSWMRSGGSNEATTAGQAGLPIRVNANVTGLVLTLGSGASVKVTVHDEMRSGGTTDNVHRASVQLTLKEFNRGSQGVIVPPMAGQPDVISGLLPGTYRVDASAMQPGYVAELRCGSVDLLRDDLVIPPGEAPPPIEVTLRDDAAQLEVGLSGKEAQGYGSVVIYSDEEPRRSVLMRTTAGHTVIGGNLAPGRYYVIAVSGAEDLEIQNPAAMEKYLDKAAVVTLGPNDKSSVRAEIQEQKAPEQ